MEERGRERGRREEGKRGGGGGGGGGGERRRCGGERGGRWRRSEKRERGRGVKEEEGKEGEKEREREKKRPKKKRKEGERGGGWRGRVAGKEGWTKRAGKRGGNYIWQQTALLTFHAFSSLPLAECCISLRGLFSPKPVNITKTLIHQGLEIGELE